MTTEGETVVDYRGYTLLPVRRLGEDIRLWLVYDESMLLVGDRDSEEGALFLVDSLLGNETDGDGIG